jgi:sporulation protein YlmC with PRC-barrel domain
MSSKRVRANTKNREVVKMVELTSLYNLDVYTTRGQYVGRIQDVVLNIKKGRVSTLKAVAMNPDKKNVGIRDLIPKGIRIVPGEDEIRPMKEEGTVEIPYDRVQAVGDIILISPEIKETPAPSQ